MQGTVGLMNNVYNLVQQQNSQALTDEILRNEENMQYAPLRTHTARYNFTHQPREPAAIGSSRRDLSHREILRSPSHKITIRHQTLSLDSEGRGGSHTPLEVRCPRGSPVHHSKRRKIHDIYAQTFE